MLNRSSMYYAVRRALAGNALALIALNICSTAHAQEAATTDRPLEEVIITGSRIRVPANITSTSPIQVVTSEEVQLTGKTDTSDVLYQLPQNVNNSIGQGFSSRTSGLSTPGGLTTADLRGLGPNRTLVLINGRRLGQGSPNTFIQSPAPDLDQIPTSLIERVDVVTGGASAVYGSDAIAGVVNFVMKQDFEGIQLDYQVGLNWHDNHSDYAQQLQRENGQTPLTGSSHDGRDRNFTLTLGTNFADGRGNVTAYLGYRETDPVTSGQRDFGGCQLNADDDLTGAVCSGSSNSNQFRLTGTTRDYSVVGNQFVPYGAQASPPAVFNSQPYIYMSRGDQRYMAGFQAHVDLNDYAKPYAEFGFMDDKTHTEVAPAALFKDSNPLDPISGNYNVNCINPLLSAQQRSILCTPAQIAADQAAWNASRPTSTNPNPPAYSPVTVNVRIGRRNIEGGARLSDFEHANYRGVFGIKGDFADAWNYDAYAQYYYTTLYHSSSKYLNFDSIGKALLVTPTGACVSGSPCVPYNIFTTGAVTPDQLEYLYMTGTENGSVTQRITHADITGDFGKYGVKLPTANDGLAVNFGYEHRVDKVVFAPDYAETSGLLSGFGSAAVAINNSIAVDEEMVELRAPLVQGKTGAEDLVFDAGFRHSNYSTSGGVNTHKFEVQYSPVRDFRIRGSYQRAIRAPSVVELYNPQLVGLISSGEDPCAPGEATHVASATLAQCLLTGVTAAQYGNGGTTNSIPQGTGSQLSQLTGGNPNLKPETADTYTYGITFTPSFLEGFSGSIDYYRIKVTDEVGVLPFNVILDTCLDTGDPVYCSQIVRSSTGGLTGNSIASKGYVIQTNINIGAAKVEGIDLQANYRVPLPVGTLAFAMNGAYLKSLTNTPTPTAHTYDCAGLFGSTCQTVNPKWRHNLRTTWQTPWNMSVSLNWRYLGRVKLDNNDPDESLHFAEFGAYNYFNAEIPSFSYFDLAATWNVWKGIQLRGGINNMFDKDPPIVTAEIVAGGAANTYETYDTLGRQVFLGLLAKF